MTANPYIAHLQDILVLAALVATLENLKWHSYLCKWGCSCPSVEVGYESGSYPKWSEKWYPPLKMGH